MAHQAAVEHGALRGGHAVPRGPAGSGLHQRKLLMWLFLASECMFFGSLISTYMIYRGHSITGPYPDEILNVPLTSISTFVLLASSFMMVLNLGALRRGNLFRFRVFILGTIVLGSVFLTFQAYEFTQFVHEGLTIKKNLFGSTFFVLTGFHGAHVTIGVIWLLSLFLASFRGKIHQGNADSVEVAGLYWHFVDIVWIVIFTLVYLIPNPPHAG